MSYVLDASFIASLFLPDEADPRSDVLVDRIMLDGGCAPALLQLEITNILLMAHRRKRITGVQLRQLSEAFDKFPVRLEPALSTAQRADVMRLAQKHQLTAYDAAYLELAMRTGNAMASLDESLLRAAKSEGVKAAI